MTQSPTDPDKKGAPSPEKNTTALGWGGEIGGILLFALSVVFMVGGWQLGLGAPTRLGTGAFPFITGAVLSVLAICIILAERGGDGLAQMPDWQSLLAIAAALGCFALLAERIGLVPGVLATIIVASLPDRSLSMRGKIVLGLIVALACWVIFVELLNLPIKPFREF